MVALDVFDVFEVRDQAVAAPLEHP